MGRRKNFRLGALLDDTTLIHHHNFIGDRLYRGEIVSDKQVRNAEFFLKIEQ